MMESYITLVERENNRWELTVKIPVKWLQRFTNVGGIRVYGRALGPEWGHPVIEDSCYQPWRYMQQGYESLALAECAAATIMEEIRGVKEYLKPRGFVKWTLDLRPDAPLGAIEERNIPGEDIEF